MIRLIKRLTLLFVSALFIQSCSSTQGFGVSEQSSVGLSSQSAKVPADPTVIDPTSGQLLEGAWGGVGVHLIADPASAALEFDCSQGEINSPIRIDKNGNFNVTGVYFHQSGGPTLEIDQTTPNGELVRYIGHISGNQMALRILFDHRSTTASGVAGNNGASSNGGPEVQELTFELTRGLDSKLYRCL